MTVGITTLDRCDVFLQALEKAKAAGSKERALVRQSDNGDPSNLGLHCSVSMAAVYQLFSVETGHCLIQEGHYSDFSNIFYFDISFANYHIE